MMTIIKERQLKSIAISNKKPRRETKITTQTTILVIMITW